MPVIGNFAIINPNVTDTGEPFCVVPKGGPAAGGTLKIACKVAGAHTVAVSCQQDVVHTIDPKYIKDMYYTDTQEVEVGTSMSGWWNATKGGENPIIPKMSVAGVVYENLPPR